MSDAARSRWDYDCLPEECPECGEDVYLAARIISKDEDGGPTEAEMMCGERFYRTGDIPGISTVEDERGCGHTWGWEREVGADE